MTSRTQKTRTQKTRAGERPATAAPEPGTAETVATGTESVTERTEVGNYFVANYPPFSFWQPEHLDTLHERLAQPPAPDTPFGLYVHIPFCRKRCDFCYFRVYTDNDAERVRRYLDALIAEMKLQAELPAIRGRRPQFVYFGGGTPSYLSADQLRYLIEGLQEQLPWDGFEEFTFECEPGTLQPKKIDALRELGVTRLSLGVENFDPEILELNNRAHRAKEIHKAYDYAREVGFDQINIDLIAGMVGESDANWEDCIAKTRAMAPESVTIYQMELPFNTKISRRMMADGVTEAPVADWPTKRRWVQRAFDALAEDGYRTSSAYTAVKDASVRFRYRDSLWHGADMLGIGVASFSHVSGVHFQNEHDYGPYVEAVEAGRLPHHRAYPTTAEERLIREFVLQLKTGRVEVAYFRDEFGVDVRERFADELREHAAGGFVEVDDDAVRVTRDGMLIVDRLLHAFFLDRHRGARYA